MLATVTEPSLNLVENQNDVVACANLAHRFEITCGRNYHPRLAIAASSAVASPKGTTRLNPGVKGPKPSRAVGSVLKPTIVRVRP
jgi:hypothetical protein